jgi:methionyl aminopeptidase
MNSPDIKQLNPEEAEKLKGASQLAASALKIALDFAEEGVSCDDRDEVVHNHILEQGGYPSAIDFHGFPKSLCTSVNTCVAHGVPNNHVLKSGDYINCDIVCFKDGFHGDNSGMVMIGDVHEDIKKLSEVTREAMFKAIGICGPGVPFKEIGKTIERYADA